MLQGIIQETEDGTLWPKARKIKTGNKKLLKMSPQNGGFSAPIKEMYVSFIFTFAERTQRRFNISQFREHFVHKKNIVEYFVLKKP